MTLGPDDQKNLHSDEALAIVILYRRLARKKKLTKEAQIVYDRAFQCVNRLANNHMPDKFVK